MSTWTTSSFRKEIENSERKRLKSAARRKKLAKWKNPECSGAMYPLITCFQVSKKIKREPRCNQSNQQKFLFLWNAAGDLANNALSRLSIRAKRHRLVLPRTDNAL